MEQADHKDAAGRDYPPFPERRPTPVIEGGRYRLHFAESLEQVRTIQELRFRVFNLELGEGLESSFETGLDQDEFDATCHHLMVELQETGEVVGTYRVQTAEMAEAGVGFYTDGEFELSGMPEDVIRNGIETGRACVASEHRNGRVLNLLWRGLATYLSWNHKHYLFGCTSLSSQNPHEGRATLEFLERGNFRHPSIGSRPRPACECFPEDFEADVNTPVNLPPLFLGYLKLGGKITGPPALDRHFKTIDFLMVLDIRDLDPNVRRFYFG